MAQASMEQFAVLARGRRTISAFLPDEVPENVVRVAFELGLWAPNHKLTAPLRIYWLGVETAGRLVTDAVERVAQKKGREAAEQKRVKWAAVPGWFALSSVRSPHDAVRDQEDFAACCCAAQNIMLALWAAGVGSKWSTGELGQGDSGAAIIGFDSNAERLLGVFMYGYPALVPQRAQPVLEQQLIRRP